MRGLAVVHPVAKSTDACALATLRPTNSEGLGAWPTAGLSSTVRALALSHAETLVDPLFN